MIIPSQHASRVALAAAGGGGGDVTPNALNWTGILGGDDLGPYQDYTEQQILGINQAITLTFTVTATTGSPPAVYYRKASTATSTTDGYGDADPNYGGTPSPTGRHVLDLAYGFASLYNGSTLVVSSLSVSSGDYLSFMTASNGLDSSYNVTIRINNQSDSNAVIDTITFQQG
jgi:hypothetical protein